MAQKHALDAADAKRLVDGETEVRGISMTVDEARQLFDDLEGPGWRDLVDELDEAQGAVHGKPGEVSYLVIKITG